jgi:transcriptional regulator with XRE-family HTH domain
MGARGMIVRAAATRLGARVKSRREELDMTLDELASAMSGSGARDASTLQQIESDNEDLQIERPPPDVIQSLERALDLAPGSLERLVDRD